MNKEKNFLSISHIDNDGENHHLFNIEKKDNKYQIVFTENTKRFFPKGFSDNDYKEGLCLDLRRIKQFLKFYLPEEMTSLINDNKNPVEIVNLAAKLRVMPIAVSNVSNGPIIGRNLSVDSVLIEGDDEHNEGVLNFLTKRYDILNKNNEIKFPAIIQTKDGLFKHVNIRSHKKQDHTDKMELHSQFLISESIESYNRENIHNQDMNHSKITTFENSTGKLYTFEDINESKPFNMIKQEKDGKSFYVFREKQMQSELFFRSDSIAYLFAGKDISGENYNGNTLLADFYSRFNVNSQSETTIKNNKACLLNNGAISLAIGSCKETQNFKINIVDNATSPVNFFEPSSFSNIKFNTKGTGSSNSLLNNLSLSQLDQSTLKMKLGPSANNWFRDSLQKNKNSSWVEAKSFLISFEKTVNSLHKKDIISKSIVDSVRDYFKVKIKEKMDPKDYYDYSRSIVRSNEALIEKYSKIQNSNDIEIDTLRTHSIKRKQPS